MIYSEVGKPAAMFPVIVGCDDLSFAQMSGACLHIITKQVDRCSRLDLAERDMRRIRGRVRELFENGFVAKTSDDAQEGIEDANLQDTDVDVGANFPIPAETIIEELCNEIQAHPISVLQMLLDGIEREHWECGNEQRRLCADRATMAVLSALGHRWPEQIEAGEGVPEWADPDGIIPIALIGSQTTLFDRIQQRLENDQASTNDFPKAMENQLDAWLVTEFFKHHTKQFKKRPIAWQIQTSSFTTRSAPAFACLVYYHKLDIDLLPKVRKLAEDLRKSRETELRGILALAPEARSERQVKRRGELEDAIIALQRFDGTLEAVGRSGFGPEPLIPALRQFAIDDAMLSLKVCWLRRLSELVAETVLPGWLATASDTGLHPEFGAWIADAMVYLDHFCTRVGPQAPEQKSLAQAPLTCDLVRLIAPEAKSMLQDALTLACDRWWERFEEIVLRPLKVRVKELKEEQKQIEERLKADQAATPTEARELKARVKELKADVKEQNDAIREKTGRAQAIRNQIENWRSDEPLSWADWLAEQPLFDRISSLDGHRPAPTTIAEFVAQESLYAPDINDGVRVNIAPLQKAGLLAADVLAKKDVDKAIADRAAWRADERRWVREGKLPQPGWWPEQDR